MDQRPVRGLQPGVPCHSGVRCDEPFERGGEPAGGAGAEMVRRQLHGGSGQVPHERHLP